MWQSSSDCTMRWYYGSVNGLSDALMCRRKMPFFSLSATEICNNGIFGGRGTKRFLFFFFPFADCSVGLGWVRCRKFFPFPEKCRPNLGGWKGREEESEARQKVHKYWNCLQENFIILKHQVCILLSSFKDSFGLSCFSVSGRVWVRLVHFWLPYLPSTLLLLYYPTQLERKEGPFLSFFLPCEFFLSRDSAKNSTFIAWHLRDISGGTLVERTVLTIWAKLRQGLITWLLQVPTAFHFPMTHNFWREPSFWNVKDPFFCTSYAHILYTHRVWNLNKEGNFSFFFLLGCYGVE